MRDQVIKCTRPVLLYPSVCERSATLRRQYQGRLSFPADAELWAGMALMSFRVASSMRASPTVGLLPRFGLGAINLPPKEMRAWPFSTSPLLFTSHVRRLSSLHVHPPSSMVVEETIAGDWGSLPRCDACHLQGVVTLGFGACEWHP